MRLAITGFCCNRFDSGVHTWGITISVTGGCSRLLFESRGSERGSFDTTTEDQDHARGQMLYVTVWREMLMRTSKPIFILMLMLALLNVMPGAASAAPGDTGRSRLDSAPKKTRAAVESPSYADLVLRAAKEGRVRIIVGVKARFTPEGNLAGVRSVEEQRRGIAVAQKALMQKATTLNARAVEAFDNIPFLAMQVDEAGLRAITADPSVASVTANKISRPSLAQSVPLIGGTRAYSSGATGLGQTIAILDTGVAKTHAFLYGKVKSEACYSTNDAPNGYSSLCPGGVTASTAAGSGVNCSTSIAGCDHGTHVAGIAAGKNGTFTGVAKNANLIAVQVFSKIATPQGTFVGAADSDIIKGLQRVYALRSTYKIASVNMSLGGGRYSTPGQCDADNAAMKAAIDNLRSAGIATIIASGNESYRDSIASPGCISSAISVGSTTKTDAISSFSNGHTNLHLLAPGSDINSSVPGGRYATFSGTSMAAPHVAGAWALMRQKAPSASVPQVLAALQTTGKAINDARPGATAGIKRRIQVNTALARLTSACNNYEPNGNTASSAREFGVGTSQLHSFCASGDQDWSKFRVTGGYAQYRIETLGLASGVDTILQVFKTTNLSTPLATHDNLSSTNKASRITITLAPGDYVVRAYQRGTYAASRTYTLRITRLRFTALACGRDEPNGTLAAAKTISTTGTTKSYAFCETPEVDIVKFSTVANRQYNLQATSVSPRVDVAIDVYELDGGQLYYLRTIDSSYAGGAESEIHPAASYSTTIYLVYYDFGSNYGPANTYGARVNILP